MVYDFIDDISIKLVCNPICLPNELEMSFGLDFSIKSLFAVGWAKNVLIACLEYLHTVMVGWCSSCKPHSALCIYTILCMEKLCQIEEMRRVQKKIYPIFQVARKTGLERCKSAYKFQINILYVAWTRAVCCTFHSVQYIKGIHYFERSREMLLRYIGMDRANFVVCDQQLSVKACA